MKARKSDQKRETGVKTTHNVTWYPQCTELFGVLISRRERFQEILNAYKFQAEKATQNKGELTSLMKKNLDFKVEPDSKV